jgi:hypothetical protein
MPAGEGEAEREGCHGHPAEEGGASLGGRWSRGRGGGVTATSMPGGEG